MHTPLDGLLQAMQAQQRYKTDGKRLGLEQQLAGNRLKTIQQGWRQNPGRAPNGTGTTGLQPADKYGWSDMLNEQTEALGLQNALSGQQQPVVREAPMRGASLSGLRSSLRPLPESHEQFMTKWGRR